MWEQQDLLEWSVSLTMPICKKFVLENLKASRRPQKYAKMLSGQTIEQSSARYIGSVTLNYRIFRTELNGKAGMLWILPHPTVHDASLIIIFSPLPMTMLLILQVSE